MKSKLASSCARWAIVATVVTTVAAQAQFTFTTNNGAITITGYTGPDGVVAIPETITGLPVTAIGNSAFQNQTSVTGLALPSTVTNLADYAFFGCSGLGNLTIPDSVLTIGNLTFTLCGGLTQVTVGSGLTQIGNQAFDSCGRLTAVCFRGNCPTPGVAVFNAAYKAAVYFLPGTTNWGSTFAGVRTAFWDPQTMLGYTTNQNTASISAYLGAGGAVLIPDTLNAKPVTSLGNGAFWGCSGLSSVTIPASVTNIDSSALRLCTNLSAVYLKGNPPTLGADTFDFDPNATMYYLPGTTNWGALFGGHPTALWRPQIQTRDPSFGVRTNQFGFPFTWASGRTVVVEVSPAPASQDWSPIATNTLTADSSCFSDGQWANYPKRFYRLRSP
jgi:BspA type Leucine rich repeat region (6 copies)